MDMSELGTPGGPYGSIQGTVGHKPGTQDELGVEADVDVVGRTVQTGVEADEVTERIRSQA